jgi:hypothetical protein
MVRRDAALIIDACDAALADADGARRQDLVGQNDISVHDQIEWLQWDLPGILE